MTLSNAVQVGISLGFGKTSLISDKLKLSNGLQSKVIDFDAYSSLENAVINDLAYETQAPNRGNRLLFIV